MGRSRKSITIAIAALAALALLCVAISPALGGIGRALGIRRPELALIPLLLIAAWVILDIAAVLIGIRIVDRSRDRERRAELRARMLRGEWFVPPDDDERS